jgi:hypothetical protein
VYLAPSRAIQLALCSALAPLAIRLSLTKVHSKTRLRRSLLASHFVHAPAALYAAVHVDYTDPRLCISIAQLTDARGGEYCK